MMRVVSSFDTSFALVRVQEDAMAKATKSTGRRALKSVASAATPDNILKLVETLGLGDLVISQIRQYIKSVDIDDLLDDATDYIKRNPEVLVVGLGAVTVAAAIVVYINNQREWDGRDRRLRRAS